MLCCLCFARIAAAMTVRIFDFVLHKPHVPSDITSTTYCITPTNLYGTGDKPDVLLRRSSPEGRTLRTGCQLLSVKLANYTLETDMDPEKGACMGHCPLGRTSLQVSRSVNR